MYDTYIMKRTQIYLDEAQAEQLARRSDARGVTTSHLIREAVEHYLAGTDDEATQLARQRVALREAFGSIPGLPDGTTFVETLRHEDGKREERLEALWRSH